MFLILSGVVSDIKKFQGLDVLNNECSTFWQEGRWFEALSQKR